MISQSRVLFKFPRKAFCEGRSKNRTEKDCSRKHSTGSWCLICLRTKSGYKCRKEDNKWLRAVYKKFLHPKNSCLHRKYAGLSSCKTRNLSLVLSRTLAQPSDVTRWAYTDNHWHTVGELEELCIRRLFGFARLLKYSNNFKSGQSKVHIVCGVFTD